jgi:putative acetyltransferase
MPPPAIIRPERPSDIPDIARVTRQAFLTHPHSSHTEEFIIESLRRSGALSVSLVAELDSHVVGHVAFSPVTISDGSQNWYGLGPVSVAPEFQRQGIGTALVKTGLDALRNRGAKGCVLLGEPEFYARFGFTNRAELRLEGVPQEFFLSLVFDSPPASGEVTYHASFLEG